MRSGIKIVKRGTAEPSQGSQFEDKEAVVSEREIASTIKSWISDREQRRRMTERTNWNLLIKFAQ